jgi:hypothetical protein
MSILKSKVNRVWLIGICITALLMGAATGQSLPTSTQNVGNIGFIYTVGIGVYGNQACTINITSVDWGTLNPGGAVQKIAYIKNSGSSNVTLSMTTNTFSPSSMQNYLSLTWNATNYVLGPNQVVTVAFALNVSPDAQGGTFNFNILITGQGT